MGLFRQYFFFLIASLPISEALIVVEGFSTRRVCCQPSWLDAPLCPLVVNNDPDFEDLHSIAHPDHPLQVMLSSLKDPYGAMDIWPCAYLATEQIHLLCLSSKVENLRNYSVVEFGAGAGLPSLACLEMEARQVFAFDIEPLPLAFLRAAVPPPLRCRLITKEFDLRQLQYDSFEPQEAHIYIASDILYKEDVASSLAVFLAHSLVHNGAELIVTDPGRKGRAAFLSTFVRTVRSLAGSDDFEAEFIDQALPLWAAVSEDPFDGSSQASTVGLLTWRQL